MAGVFSCDPWWFSTAFGYGQLGGVREIGGIAQATRIGAPTRGYFRNTILLWLRLSCSVPLQSPPGGVERYPTVAFADPALGRDNAPWPSSQRNSVVTGSN